MTTIISVITLKPIFHWKLGSHWLPNANEINTQKMKCTWPMQEFAFGTQHILYSTDLRWGFALGDANFHLTQVISSVFRYQHVGIGNAKFWRWVSKPTPVPNTNGFASQWNIGLITMKINKMVTLPLSTIGIKQTGNS